MYLDHFQLKYQPFSEHATVTSLWNDKRMDEGLARLDYLLEHGELGLVTGPSGVGKSALLKRFLSGLTPQQCETVYCHLTHLPSAGLLKMLVNQLGEVPRRGKDRLYEQIQERAQRVEGTLLLVFDEAHLLNAESLTDLRLLISSALDVGPLLKILLVGQEPLRNTLKRGQHADLSNRISVRYQLVPPVRSRALWPTGPRALLTVYFPRFLRSKEKSDPFSSFFTSVGSRRRQRDFGSHGPGAEGIVVGDVSP